MSENPDSRSASVQIDAKIDDLGDWRGETLAAVRELIHAAVPEVIEEIKYRKPTNPAGVPIFSHEGTICTGETYKGEGQAHLRQRRFTRGPRWTFQLESGRQGSAGHRHFRRRRAG